MKRHIAEAGSGELMEQGNLKTAGTGGWTVIITEIYSVPLELVSFLQHLSIADFVLRHDSHGL